MASANGSTMNLFSQKAVMPSAQTTGIILAGGASKRMGRDKATLPWGNETVLQHLVTQLSPRLRPIIVVGSPLDTALGLPEHVVYVRDHTAHQGPLVGFSQGLTQAPHHQLVFLTGCDFPYLRPKVVDFLHSRLGDSKAVVAESEGIVQPLIGLYQQTVINNVGQLIQNNVRSLNALISELNCRVVTQEEWRQFDPDCRMLTNINTPEEYQAAHNNYLASLGG